MNDYTWHHQIKPEQSKPCKSKPSIKQKQRGVFHYRNTFYVCLVICQEQSRLPPLQVDRNFKYASKHVWAVSLSESVKISGVCRASHNSIKLHRVLKAITFPPVTDHKGHIQELSDGWGWNKLRCLRKRNHDSSGGSALPQGSQATAKLERVSGLQGGAPTGHYWWHLELPGSRAFFSFLLH